MLLINYLLLKQAKKKRTTPPKIKQFIENVKTMTLDEIKDCFPLEGETEEDIAEALDILSEDMPGYFANSKGKVKYSFPLFFLLCILHQLHK